MSVRWAFEAEKKISKNKAILNEWEIVARK